MKKEHTPTPLKRGLKDKLIETFLGGIIEKKVGERMQATSMTDYRKEDEGWRKLTGNSTREMLSTTQDRMIDIAFWLWENNPLGRWIIEIIKDFIVADGLPFEAKNNEVHKLLEDFWFDPVNRMDLYMEKHARELHIFGELTFPEFVAAQTGRVRLGYLDPKQIDQAVTDPENVKMTIGIILKGEGGNQGRRFKTILPEDADFVLSETAKAMRDSFTDGECFFFTINNVTNSPRGRSEILVTSDWLDAYEQFLFDYTDRWPLLNTFIWDLLVTDGDKISIDEQIKAFTKKSGSVFGHNQKVTLEAKTPDLKSQEADIGARLLRNHILGAHGIPSFWYGGGDDANRAIGVEMGTPAFKMLGSKQRYFKYILETIFDRVIYKALQANYLQVPEEEAYDYSVNLPEVTSRDIAKYSTAIQQLTISLTAAQNQGWIDKDTSSKIFAFALSMIGYEMDIVAVQEAVAKEEEAKGYTDYKKTVKSE
jgi:hypothetical protein